jgi:hypothetical protein
MRNRPQFQVPVRFFIEQPSTEKLPSDTPVLMPRVRLREPLIEVVRVPGSRSPHIPERKPRFSVEFDRRQPPMILCPMRLDQVPMYGQFIVQLPVARKQRCVRTRPDVLHATAINESGYSHWTVCLENPYISVGDQEKVVVESDYPTCPKCLAESKVWVVMVVGWYERPSKDRTAQRKQRMKERKYLQLPTVFDRLLLDDPLEPPPKVEPPKAILPEPDPFEAYETSPREEKLASNRDRAERWKTSKRSMRS